MNIKETIQSEYNDAVKNNYRISKFALEELLNYIKNDKDDNDIFDTFEKLIEERAQKIMKYNIANKVDKIETDIYLMNLYNTYLCKFKFKKKRQIILIYDEDDPHNIIWNRKIETEPKEIIYKKKWYNRLF